MRTLVVAAWLWCLALPCWMAWTLAPKVNRADGPGEALLIFAIPTVLLGLAALLMTLLGVRDLIFRR